MTENAYTRRYLKDPPKEETKDVEPPESVPMDNPVEIAGSVQIYEDEFGNPLREADEEEGES